MDGHEGEEPDTSGGSTTASTPASPVDNPSARPAGRAKGTMITLVGGVLALALVALLVVSRLSGGGSTGLSGAQASATAQAAGTATAGAALATTTAQAQATAHAAPTATAEALTGLMRGAHVVYAAHVPGPGCDAGGANWATGGDGSAVCLPGGLLVTAGATQQAAADVFLVQLPTGNFPRHYLLSVTLNNLQAGTVALIEAAGASDAIAVNVFADRFSILAGNQVVASGALDGTRTTKVGILALGGETLFLINGAVASSYAGAPLAASDFDLGASSADGSSPGRAEFSDFTLSALP